MLVDRTFVEGVQHGRLAGPALGDDVGGDRFERLLGPTGEEDPRSLARERAGDARAQPAGSIDHRVLAFEQHVDPLGGNDVTAYTTERPKCNRGQSVGGNPKAGKTR